MNIKDIKTKKIIKSLCIAIIVLAISFGTVWGSSAIYENQRKNNVDTTLQQQINDDVESAIFRIVVETVHSGENVSSFCYEENGCGVLFDIEDGFCYALTAAHVIEESEEFSFDESEETELTQRLIIIPFNAPTYRQAKSESETYISATDFYSQFPVAEVIYSGTTCDLSIIRFQCDGGLNCLSLADNDPARDERIVVFGSDNGSGPLISYGVITSEQYETFDTDDGRVPDQVLKHNAYVKPGCSGAAVLNEQMQIVGINIGGSVNFFGKYKSGAMIPVNIIKEVLDQWQGQ